MIRSYRAADAPAVLALNAACVPEVGPLDQAKLDRLVGYAVDVSVVDVGDAVEGCLVLLPPGTSYGSPNYAWFCERYSSFVYVDRIMLSATVRGQGWGPALYERAERLATASGAEFLLAEVNTIPANPRSLRFHEVFGFDQLERVRPYGPDEEVVMLAKPLG